MLRNQEQPGGNINLARSYDKNKVPSGKNRSNTIEISNNEKDSRKNLKRKDRAGSSLDQEAGSNLLQMTGGNTGSVQVSDGSILIGPGGRPKTSGGKHTTM
jgi:hypothetical protein